MSSVPATGVPAVVLSTSDNVATLLAPVEAGATVAIDGPQGVVELRALEAIALGHKVALVDMPLGERILKYGECIGHATTPIRRGAWVHIHNLRSLRAQAEGPA